MEAALTQSRETTEITRESVFGLWLHRSYFRAAALRHFLVRRIRPAGGIVLGATLVAGCLAAGNGRVAVYQLFSLCVFLAGITLPWAMLRRANLRASRQLPAHATAGETLRFPIQVTNAGRRPIARAWLWETPPDPRPDRSDFLTLREPEEHTRNAFDRKFAWFRWQWLLHRNRMFAGADSIEEILLEPGESMRATVAITPLRRGIVRLADLRVSLPDPLGLFQGSHKVAAETGSIIVLPRRYPLPAFEMPGSSAYQIAGEATTHALGQSGEFASLRDYRPGDPLRQIHWKSWARTGRPIVKEVEDTHYPRYGLVLDTHAPDESGVSSFEEAVSVAASFAADIATDDSLLDLMFVNDRAYRVTAGRGVERAEKLLEALAGVAPSRQPNHRAVAELVSRFQDDLISCIVVLNGWDPAREEFLRSLARGGLACVPVVVTSAEGAPGYRIDPLDPATGLAMLPARLQAF